MPCLATTLQKKNENDIANTIKKPHNFVRETKNYLKKNPNDLEKLHPDFSEEEKKEKQLGMWVSLPKSRYHRTYFKIGKLFQF